MLTCEFFTFLIQTLHYGLLSSEIVSFFLIFMISHRRVSGFSFTLSCTYPFYCLFPVPARMLFARVYVLILMSCYLLFLTVQPPFKYSICIVGFFNIYLVYHVSSYCLPPSQVLYAHVYIRSCLNVVCSFLSSIV